MANQSSFANIAGNFMDKVLDESIKLTAEQEAAKEEYNEAKKALSSQVTQIENARRKAVREIDKKAKEKKTEISERSKKLEEAYHEELIRLGVKPEDIALVDRDVIKQADKTAKKVLGGVGRFVSYIKDGVENGASK